MTEKKLCLLDRDGVLNVDKAYLCKAEDVEWVPGSREARPICVKQKMWSGFPEAVKRLPG